MSWEWFSRIYESESRHHSCMLLIDSGVTHGDPKSRVMFYKLDEDYPTRFATLGKSILESRFYTDLLFYTSSSPLLKMSFEAIVLPMVQYRVYITQDHSNIQKESTTHFSRRNGDKALIFKISWMFSDGSAPYRQRWQRRKMSRFQEMIGMF